MTSLSRQRVDQTLKKMPLIATINAVASKLRHYIDLLLIFCGWWSRFFLRLPELQQK